MSYLLLGPDLKQDLDVIQSSYLSNAKMLKVFGDGKSKINCVKINIPSYSHIMINAHGHEESATALCQETVETNLALYMIAKDKPQNFELFSCHSGAAINPELTLSKSSTLITSTHDARAALSSFNLYKLVKLSELSTNNPFIRFAHYIYLVADEVKFSIQTSKSLLHYSSEFNTIKNYSNEEMSKWRDVKLIDFINWVKSINSNIDDLQRSAEIIEFIKEFLDYKEVTTKLSRQYNIETYKGYLLINAVFFQDTEIIDNLITSSDVVIDFQNIDEVTALYIAVSKGYAEIVQKLIDVGADANIKADDGTSALHAAAKKGHAEVLQKLIKGGANLNIQDNDGNTALMIAIEYNHPKIAQIIIDAEPNLNLQNNNGNTALMIAIKYNHPEIAQIIIDAEPNLNLQNNDGNTALHAVASSHFDEAIAQKLIDAHADPAIKNNQGFSAFHIAVYDTNYKIIQYLIDANVDLNIQDNYGQTPLHIALAMHNIMIAYYLIDAGADLNIQDISGLTPLLCSVQNGDKEMLQQLIDAGADLNIKYNDKSLLDSAIYNNYFNTVKIILSNGYNRFDQSVLLEALKEIQEEVYKFNENPVKYILENNNIAWGAERALSTFLKNADFKPEAELIAKIHFTEECLAAQDHYTAKLDLYALCGEHGSWYQAEL